MYIKYGVGIVIVFFCIVFCEAENNKETNINLFSNSIDDPIEILRKKNKEYVREILNALEQNKELSCTDELLFYYSFLALDKDKYSKVLTWKETKQIEGKNRVYCGIGALVKRVDKEIHIIPLPGTPADKLGIKSHWVLVKVNDKNVLKMSFNRLKKNLLGEEGTIIKLLFRDRSKFYSKTIKRVKYTYKSIQKKIYNDSMYIWIPTFVHPMLESKIILALKEFKRKKLKSLIFDLRGNSGGLVRYLINIMKYLLPNRYYEIYSVKGVYIPKQIRKLFRSMNYTKVIKGLGVLPNNIHIAVVVDNNTASASEMMCMMLREFRGAIVIGEKTFGKGSIQACKMLDSGHMAVVTVGEWYVNKSCIQNQGVSPDIQYTDLNKIDLIRKINSILRKHIARAFK